MIENLISFFKKTKEETKGKTPEGVCPNCWGEQEYDNTIRELYEDKQIDVNNKEANYAFIQKFAVDHLSGITLKKGTSSLECPTCKLKIKPNNKEIMTEEVKHIETFKAVAKGKGWPTKVNITDTEWTIQVDEPEEDGGTNSGPNPMQLFSAALAGCQNEQAQVVAEELEVSIKEIDINLEIDLDLAGFMGDSDNSIGSYKEVRFSAEVKGNLTSEQIQELGKRVDARCPILVLLRSAGCNIISSWK